MIAVDPSALLAILLAEEDAGHYVDALESATEVILSAPSYVELCAVMKHKRGPQVLKEVDAFLRAAGIRIEAFTPTQSRIAATAYAAFGDLNFGDVFSYALAKDKSIPLLFKGNDFTKTDIPPYAPV